MTIITVGRFGSPYGVQGWLKVQSFTSPIENILLYRPWKIHYQRPKGEGSASDRWDVLPIKASRFTSNQIIVQIEGCLSPEEARRYTNLEIGICSDLLPSLPVGEYYWSQLIGLQVVTTDGVELGIVDHLMETGSNDVLVIKGEKTRLVPYLPNRVVQSIDLSLQKMIVDWDPDF